MSKWKDVSLRLIKQISNLKWSVKIRAIAAWLLDLKFYSDKPVYAHKVFWLVVLLPIIIASYLAIPLTHELVFHRSYDSYKFFLKTFQFPLWISSGSIIFGVIVARFHFSSQRSTSIAQVSKQLLMQESQIEKLEIQRKSENLAIEIRELSTFILKLTDKIEVPPKFYIEKAIKEVPNATGCWEKDYTNKLIKIDRNNSFSVSLNWEGTIKYLNVFISENKDNLIESYAYIEESHKIYHQNIALQLNTLIVVCRNLAELDNSYYQYIKNKLSNHYSVIQVLYKVELISSTMLEVFLLLQQLDSPDNTIKVNLSEIFAKELNAKFFLNRIVEPNEIKFKIKKFYNTDNYLEQVFLVTIGQQRLQRLDGVWGQVDESFS